MMRLMRAAALVIWASLFAPVTVATDAAGWRMIDSSLLTPDGKWLVYVSSPYSRAPGEAFVIRRSTEGEIESRYSAGNVELGGGGNLKLSPSGKWIAFHVAASAALDVVLVDVSTGMHTAYPGVQQFEFIRDGKGAKEAILLQQGAELTVQALGQADRTRLASEASAFSVNPSQTRVAWTDKDGLHAYDAGASTTRKLDSGPGSEYSSLTWSARGEALGAIRVTASKQELVVFRNVGRGRATVLDLRQWKELPQGYSLVAPLQWRDDERGLFIGVQAPSKPVPADAVPGLRVWHWKDEYLPGYRRVMGPRKDWCFVDLDARKFVQLSGAGLATVEPHGSGRYVLGYDLEKYGWFNKGPLRAASAIRQLRDYYRVDVKTGRRDLIVAGLKVWARPGISIPPTLSPDGSMLVYQDGSGDIILTEMETLERRSLTASVPTKFYFPENHPRNDILVRDNYGQGLPRIQGWSADGRFVLASDHYDIWALPLRSGQALNLTRDGRRQEVWYQLALKEVPTYVAAPRVDLNAPLYFRYFELNTARQGLALRRPGKEQLEELHSDYASLEFIKARDADVHLVARETAADSRDYFRLDANWARTNRLTDINPQQREMASSPGAKFLAYSSPGGTRHAALHLPVDYASGRAYPTIVMIYKGLSTSVHTNRSPDDEISEFLARGYAVLLPDILPRVDDPGAAAVEDVTAGVNAAVQTGVVDREHLGLTGHSFGGYETNFIITQTDLFKAAVAHAGVTDLLSSKGSVYGDIAPSAQGDQPYLSGPWWSLWDAHVKNSPLFQAQKIATPLLLVHGDRDSAVSMEQSLELFNALRIMGDKPVVLLEYKGEEHDFENPNLYRDFKARRAEFFDHFLKGAPAPEWWANGVSLYEGQVAPR